METTGTLSIALACALAAGAGFAAELTPAAAKEVQHLLAYLETSGCQFLRNGSWHSSPDARRHLQQKYDYLARKGMLSSAESFLELGASASSASGKPYRVRCPGDAEPTPSATWLKAELDRYRRKAR